MAHILPDAPLSSCTPEAARVFRHLKRLPDEQFVVWQRLAIWDRPGPDFWVLRSDRRAVLIKVVTSTPAEAQAALQGQLFEIVQTPSESAADGLAALTSFAAQVLPSPANSLWQQVPGLLLCPNLGAADLATYRMSVTASPGIHWASKEVLAAGDFERWLTDQLGAPLSPDLIAALRVAIAPEVVIPPSFSVRKPIERNTQAQLTSYLLDPRQEQILKTDLDLSDEARAVVDDFNLRLINGVAGSGKSLIVVYRAHLLHQLFPEKRILGLTLNKPLIHDLEARYCQLSKSQNGVIWQNFHQWCRGLKPSTEPRWQVISIAARQRLIAEIWQQHLSDTSISERMFQEELDWFKDRLIFGREDYVNVDRARRGFGLAPAMREKMYDAFVAYQKELKRRDQLDWGDLPRRIWRLYSDGTLTLPVYDVVLIDEAQFFAPLWFEIIKRIVKPGTGHLFLAADPTQGFLKRGHSWRASGLEVRGRTLRLEKSYRTTREILSAATLLYRTQLPNDDEEIIAPNLLGMPSGALPFIVPVTSEQDEVTRVVNEVRALHQTGAALGDMLIIHAHWQGVDRLAARLRREFGTEAVIDPKDAPKGNQIRVVTLNAATGLESPIVFLCGVHQLYEEEQSVRLSDDERAELIRDNTRKLYMAITRAGQRLVLTYVGELPDILKQLGTMA